MAGYYRMPTIHGETIVFVCEDDLWAVSVGGGVPRRLTASVGAVKTPLFSPDGRWLAFSARDEGPWEVYLMDGLGGEPRRLTYQGANAEVAAWTPEGDSIVYSSNAAQPFPHVAQLWRIEAQGGEPILYEWGPSDRIAFGPNGALVLARHARRDPSWWKRYRGGTAGQLWIDRDGSRNFVRLTPANGNFTSPMWIGERIYFLSDHEGIGNLYSCLPDGSDLRRHTHHEEYYARNATTDGRRIVYHAGAEIYLYDVETDTSRKVEIEYRSPRVQRQRKFVSTGQYLQEYMPHPDGHALALTVRGKPFTFANWEGAVVQHGVPQGVRYRLTQWLNDGKRLITVSDADGEERLEILTVDGSEPPRRFAELDFGRPIGLEVSPVADAILLANNRMELWHVNLETGEAKRLDHSEYGTIRGASWSPDGQWIAYGIRTGDHVSQIRIVHVESGEIHEVTHREFFDFSPTWDPDGNYLYFLSYREFNPVYDALQFELSFPQAMRPMLITLRADLPDPFVPQPRPLQEKPEKKNNDGDKQAKEETKSPEEEQKETEQEAKEKKPKPVRIDFEGIRWRVRAFPYPEGIYSPLFGLSGKVIFASYPKRPSFRSPGTGEEGPQGTLHLYEFKDQRKEVLVTGISDFELSRDRTTLVYRAGDRLRVIKAGEKPPEDKNGGFTRRSGWVDLNRVRCAVVPAEEWRQMYREAWRLQREYFWTPDMSGVDWELVYRRYLPLLERVATRTEFSDLMWEMQGELGTSHCYEMGGDYRPGPNYALGFLGADLRYDPETDAYRIVHIVRGDPWNEEAHTPLGRPGVNVQEGDLLLAINGQRLSRELPPGAALLNLANQEVELTVRSADEEKPRTVTVRTLPDEYPPRYREWVARNREYVHEKTEGQVGYVHIPDMGPRGFAEFHRGYLAELDYPSLLIDVRHNRGGHVSSLLLEKLARRRIGYDVQRWGKPIPYPYESVMGPMVALTDENAGSDGDIFSHCFKLMKLGPLVGVRTWGGVIGISPKSTFVDGGRTTQPEYAFWFVDVGWGVENYGTDPDIEVPYRPQDYLAGVDPQLDKAIEVILQLIAESPPQLPDFSERPRLTLPELPR
ncbi:MAG: tricorn protease [Candidatus Poribacteria bacterium]|nr:MAG: tricorn protease [Candidatus Poribacteria bacterium]